MKHRCTVRVTSITVPLRTHNLLASASTEIKAPPSCVEPCLFSSLNSSSLHPRVFSPVRIPFQKERKRNDKKQNWIERKQNDFTKYIQFRYNRLN